MYGLVGDWQTSSIKGQLVNILSLHSQWSLAHLFNFAVVLKQLGTYIDEGSVAGF